MKNIKEIEEKFDELVSKEIIIAINDGEKTSRLTSLANKFKEFLNIKFNGYEKHK